MQTLCQAITAGAPADMFDYRLSRYYDLGGAWYCISTNGRVNYDVG